MRSLFLKKVLTKSLDYGRILSEQKCSVWKHCFCKKRVYPTVSGTGKSSVPYCEWEL